LVLLKKAVAALYAMLEESQGISGILHSIKISALSALETETVS